MKLSTVHQRATRRRGGFTLLEVLVVVAILVILAGVGVVATTSYLERARRNEAQLKCSAIAQAVESYYLNPQSGNNYPETLEEVVNLPGGSALKNGLQDLVDPWQQRYQLTYLDDGAGNRVPLVFTRAKDGTPISQHGVGNLSRVQ